MRFGSYRPLPILAEFSGCDIINSVNIAYTQMLCEILFKNHENQMEQTMKKILKKWQLWYWIMVFIFLRHISSEEMGDIAAGIYLIAIICPAFFIINIIVLIIKNRLAVIKNWKFWIWAILLFVNLFWITRPVRHASSVPIYRQPSTIQVPAEEELLLE